MQRATKPKVTEFMAPYVWQRPGMVIMLHEDVDMVTNRVMEEFSGVYCGTSINRGGNLVFRILSTSKTKRVYFQAVVR